MIACVDAEPEHVAPDVVDRYLAGDDALDRRLGYVLTALNIAGAILVLVYMVQVLDETSGGTLKRWYETWREREKHRVKKQQEYDMSVKRLQFEAWSALRDASATEDTDE
jgi:predicted YcjX-like family ATPase